MTGDLTGNLFKPYEGSTFTATSEGVAVALVLAEVEEIEPIVGSPRAEPFRLMLTGPAGARFESGMYVLEHEALGTFDMHLMPRRPTADGLPRLEALFD